MGFPAVTYTFSNGSTADATQVNQNFTDLINGLSDTTKNLSISALTLAGTLTVNANMTLGNSSANTLTFTASLNSSIPLNTTFSYDIGTNAIGLRSIYLGDAGSNARSTRLIGATIASAYTMTLPTAVPGFSHYLLEGDTSATLSFSSRNTQQLSTKTNTYAILGGDDFIIADGTSNAYSVTLPSPSTFSGRIFRIKRLDATFTIGNLVTIARNGSEKIDGVAANVFLATQGEMYELISNGTDWFVVSHTYPQSLGTALSFTIQNCGTVASTTYVSRRVADCLEVIGHFTAGTIVAAVFSITLPTGYVIDTTKLPAVTTELGLITELPTGSTALFSGNLTSAIFYDGSDTAKLYAAAAAASGAYTKNNAGTITTTGAVTAFHFKVPIANWAG